MNDVDGLERYAYLYAGGDNERVPCERIPDMDFDAWRDSPPAAAPSTAHITTWTPASPRPTVIATRRQLRLPERQQGPAEMANAGEAADSDAAWGAFWLPMEPLDAERALDGDEMDDDRQGYNTLLEQTTDYRQQQEQQGADLHSTSTSIAHENSSMRMYIKR